MSFHGWNWVFIGFNVFFLPSFTKVTTMTGFYLVLPSFYEAVMDIGESEKM